jgi:hypothetical protein
MGKEDREEREAKERSTHGEDLELRMARLMVRRLSESQEAQATFRKAQDGLTWPLWLNT